MPWKSQTSNIYREKNEGVMMRCKTIMDILWTILRLLVEPIQYLEKPKASLEQSLSISKPPWTVTYIKPVISPSLSSFLSFSNILRFNRYQWSTVLSYVGNSAGLCQGINTTGNMKFTAGINCISIIDLIKGD